MIVCDKCRTEQPETRWRRADYRFQVVVIDEDGNPLKTFAWDGCVEHGGDIFIGFATIAQAKAKAKAK
jgi:hypothetical protein